MSIINLYPEEKVVLELRRHWFIFFLETIFLVIFICLPFFLLRLSERLDIFSGDLLANGWFTLLAAIWFLIVWVIFFVIWTNFYLDAWIITDRRIIDIEQYNLFNREIAEFRISKIQNITVNINGFIPTMLGFGDILIETAADEKQCRIKDAPHPEKVKNLISALQTNLAPDTDNTLDK